MQKTLLRSFNEQPDRRRRAHRLHWYLLAMMILNLAGCADILSSLTPPWKEMAITDAKSVGGKWEGLLTRLPRSWRDDWVSITIGEDGSYVWANYRQIGAFSG